MWGRLFSLALLILITLGLVMHEAEAKRFGGGRSFGMQRSTSTFTRNTANQGSHFAQSRFGANQRGSTMSKWLGPLAGLAAGGILASLFMGKGLGSGILSWLLMGGVLLLIVSFVRKWLQPRAQFNANDGYGRHFAQDRMAPFQAQGFHGSSAPVGEPESHSQSQYPVGFDAATFLRDAKVQFIRMQAAYDQKNLNDLREFTTPEVYAEIQLQFHERGSESNKTDVISVNAELLDVTAESQMIATTDMQAMVATVKFSGFIQENPQEPAAAFNEIWHFKKEIGHNRWLVAGIQQNA